MRTQFQYRSHRLVPLLMVVIMLGAFNGFGTISASAVHAIGQNEIDRDAEDDAVVQKLIDHLHQVHRESISPMSDDEIGLSRTIWVISEETWDHPDASGLRELLRPWLTQFGPAIDRNTAEQLLDDPPTAQSMILQPEDREDRELTTVNPNRHMVSGESELELLLHLFDLEDKGLVRLHSLVSTVLRPGSVSRGHVSGTYDPPNENGPANQADWSLIHTIEAFQSLEQRLGLRFAELLAARDVGDGLGWMTFTENFVGTEGQARILGAAPTPPTDEDLADGQTWPTILISYRIQPAIDKDSIKPAPWVPSEDADAECVYEESFAEPPQGKTWECDGLQARWCEQGLNWGSKNGCPPGQGSITVNPGAAENPRLWYHFGDRRPKAVRITFKHLQPTFLEPPYVPTAGRLEYRIASNDDFDCPGVGYSEAMTFPAQWDEPLPIVCTRESYMLHIVDENARGVWFRFSKRRPDSGMGVTMLIDDVRVEFIE